MTPLRASAPLAALLVVGCNAPGICDTGAECGSSPWSTTEMCSCYSPARVVLEPHPKDPTTIAVMCRCPRPALDGGKRQ